MRKFTLSAATTLAACVVTALVPTAADAAKSLPANLSASPEYGSAWVGSDDTVTFSGCGYHGSAGVAFNVNGPTAVATFGAPADAAGCVNVVESGLVTTAGTYSVQAFQADSHGRWVAMAKTSFNLS
jgi:hypothetical protein